LARYLTQYAVRLDQHLAVAPFVEGVLEFITNHQGSRYVCSSAPETEVHEQIARRSLRSCFVAIYGGTTPKQDALRKIAALHENQPVVFFGDSVGDYEASCQAKVEFIGIVSERDNFQGLPVVTLKDFTSAAEIENALRQSAAQSAA
jgi:phosphoglycolate phosphatase-like HAD superfamily hydrolase